MKIFGGNRRTGRMKLRPMDWRNWFMWFLLGVAIIVVYKSFDKVSDIFEALSSFWKICTPFIIAFALAYFLGKPMNRLEKWLKKQTKLRFAAKHARGVSLTVVYLIFIGLMTLLGSAVIPALISGINSIVSNYRTYFDTAESFVADLTAKYPVIGNFDLGSKALQMAEEFVENLDVETIIGYLESVVNVGSTLSNILVGLFISIYMLLEKEQLRAFCRRFLSFFCKPATIDFIARYVRRTDEVVFKYFYTQFIDCVIVSVMSTIALAVLGAPSPVLLGFVFGMFNMIQYFGPIIAGVIVVFIILVSRGFSLALWSAIVLLVLQQIDANIINPKILSDSLDMSPFWVVFAITIGGGLFGFMGMLLSVPVLAVLRMLYRELLVYNKKRRAQQERDERKSALAAAGLSGDFEMPDAPTAAPAAPAAQSAAAQNASIILPDGVAEKVHSDSDLPAAKPDTTPENGKKAENDTTPPKKRRWWRK